MVEAKNGKWATPDNQEFETMEAAVLHKREVIRLEAIAAGCKTPEEIKTFRKRYWVIRQHDKMEKMKKADKN